MLWALERTLKKVETNTKSAGKLFRLLTMPGRAEASEECGVCGERRS